MTTRRLLSLAPLACAAALLACSSGDRLLIEITHPAGRDLARWDGELRAVLVRVQDRAVVADATLPTRRLEAPVTIFEGLELTEGEAYVVALGAALTGNNPCHASVAVGVSPPFTYGAELETLAVNVDCADQASPAGLLSQARLYHTATFLPTPLPHGRVVIAGGGSLRSLADLADLAQVEVHDSIEILDVASSSFRPADAPLSRRRAFHQATAAGPDRVLITGGLDTVEVAGKRLLTSLDLVDLFEGGRVGALAPLSTPRGMHAALLVAPDRLLVAGGLQRLLVPGASAELYDPLRGASAGELPKMSTAHVAPAVVGIGAAALLIGGAWLPNIALKEDLFCLDGSCGGCAGPCFAGLPGFPKGEGRTHLAAAQVPCSDGGPGAAYVVGGRHNATEDGSVPARVYDDIYCLDFARAEEGLRLVGHLHGPRQGHTVTTVRGPEGQQRLFVAGGFDGESQLLKTAELVPASCRCPSSEITPAEISVVPLSSERFGHTATLLADGSVLLAGGVIGGTTAERFTPAL